MFLDSKRVDETGFFRPKKRVPAKKGGKKKKRGNEQDLFGDSFDDYFNEEG
jgi:hypothetical protein